MPDEPIDQRPRRRLFGRRRIESVDQTAHIDHATVTDNGETQSEPPGPSPALDAALAHEREPEPEARESHQAEEPEAREDEEAMATANPHPVSVPASSPEPPPDVEPPAVIPPPAVIEPEVELGIAELEIVDPEIGERIEAVVVTIEEPARAPQPEGVTGGARTPEPSAAALSDHEHAGELPLPRVIAIANQKGGVGKTTTAVNLGAALAEAGFRVLVVDLDPQGNASTGLGINPRDVESSIYDVLMSDAPALDCVEPTSLKNLFVLPATIDLAGAEIELVSAFSRELKLRRALDTVRSEYDVILIDCPPSLGLLTVNGLAAADDVIVPVQSEYYALEGLGQLLKNVAMIRSLNPTLDVRGIVLTMHDSRTKLAEQVESEVREHFGARVYKTVVPRTVRLSEAPSFGQPIIVFDPTSRGATAYRELAKEVSGGATRRSG